MPVFWEELRDMGVQSLEHSQSLRLLPTNTYSLRGKGQGFWRGVESRIESPVQSLDLCQPSTPK